MHGSRPRRVIPTRSGRELVFGLYFNNVPLADPYDVFAVVAEYGAIVEALFERF